MKKMIKKVIAPVLVIAVLFAVLRPFCIQDGKCNYFLLLLLMRIPFGIGKMCVWMVPRGFAAAACRFPAGLRRSDKPD